MTDCPDDIAMVIRMRAEERPERDIARALGTTRKNMWQRVRHWNERHPDRPVPRPITRPKVFKYEVAARMWKEGATIDMIARATGTSRERAKQNVYAARAKGLLPPQETRDRDGKKAWRALVAKGAAPPFGHMGAAMASLTADEARALLELARPTDTSAAALLVRLVKESLNAQETRG